MVTTRPNSNNDELLLSHTYNVYTDSQREEKIGRWAIAIHGGAGVDPNLPPQRQEEAKQLLTRCLNLEISALRCNATAIDVVELVVTELETDPMLNSGRGSALTVKGIVEMDASIMDGPKRRYGIVSGLTTVRNPISLARLVMDKSPHSYLAFSSAEEFARQQGAEVMDNKYFITLDNVGMLKLAKESNAILFDYRIPTGGKEMCGANVESPLQMSGLPINVYTLETVECMVVDSEGRCAAATSTGGLKNKMSGRIGDSSIIGSGTYACEVCGVSCTGEGEAIIHGTLACGVAAVMEYKGMGLQWAVDFIIKHRLDEGKAGLIVVSNSGEVACGFNCNGMFRACAAEDGFMQPSHPLLFSSPLSRSFSNPSTPPPWYQYRYSDAERSLYRLRSFNSYLDLRQLVPVDEHFRFHDDTRLFLQEWNPRLDFEEDHDIGIENVTARLLNRCRLRHHNINRKLFEEMLSQSIK
ncbi:hypothetical protein RJT34_08583 [Clitoria ternatea]|uniref:beta-aspartyl-peptidase n=1 Tax=Clitoria ternatea TaxID=43366 RepID=A0AAN9K5Z5_CLITE